MRRSRIKAMASVPARRKPTKDAKDETETTKPIPTEISKEKTDFSESSCPESLERSVPEILKLNTTKGDVDTHLEPPKQTEPPQPELPIKTEEAKPTPVTEVNSMVPLEKPAESVETSIKKDSDVVKQTAVVDNSQASASDDTKTASANIDAPSIAKTSQTRASFMRPTPRFDGGGRMRRNSVQGSGASASESEDDSRRGTTVITNRVRNDSVNSTHSPKRRSQSQNANVNGNPTEITTDGDANGCENLTKMSLTSTVRRKLVVSESARKLAEARREFLLKHEHKQPDKSKLIMYDLIYYNPVTNPMKAPDCSASLSAQKPSSSVITAESEDDEDGEDDPGDAMPVPQVKVGPDGSLVIDEQSLVIEHTGAKKSRRAMARTEALVDEDGHGSGFYKKRPKSKEWPKWETLKFYKALNTVGTDFLLMQTLFPKRSRREIKLKFKKEEKVNPRLVEKALAHHQEFDIDSLKEDLATFEETVKKQTELAEIENQTTARQRGKKRKKSKSRRMAATSISEMNELPSVPEVLEATSSPEPKKNGQRRSLAADTTGRSESAVSSNESGSDTEIYQIKPTRYGRIPKVRKLQAPTMNDPENTFSDDEDCVEVDASAEIPSSNASRKRASISSKDDEKTTIVRTEDKNSTWKSQNLENSLSGISQVEPGSLVIVSRESADDPGETVLQVYMVSSDIDDGKGSKQKNMTPVVLTPELLNTVTAGITKVAPIDVKPE